LRGGFFLLILFLGTLLRAQDTTAVITDIRLQGNKKTRRAVVLRELPMQPGDTIPLRLLADKLIEGEQQLMNTGLFRRAEITYKEWKAEGNLVVLQVELLESWYIYPVPIFELADRNFNVWWTEQGRDLERVNLGLKFAHYNFTGRRDRLRVGFQTGYTQEFTFGYRIPAINNLQTLGASVDFSFDRNREVGYQSEGNTVLFFNDESQFLRKRFRLEASLTYRKRLYTRHQFIGAYHRNEVDRVIAQEINPDYYGDGREELQYFRLNYLYTEDRRDRRAYPWKGRYNRVEIEKAGVGFFKEREGLTLLTDLRRFYPLGKRERWSLGLGLVGKYSLIRSRQPDSDNQAFGYGANIATGYQLNVIDGLDMVLAKFALRRKLLDTEFTFGKWVFLPAYRRMPVQVVLSVRNDHAYVNAPYTRQRNSFANQYLFGYGLGLDFIVYYDMVFGVQYGRNHLAQGQFLLNFDLGI
jgi:outer membrane protein assembly factor BamA